MPELFCDEWRLDDLDFDALGDFVPPRPSDQEKQTVWDSYRAGRPTRVPMIFGTTDRVVIFDNRFNTGDLTYELIFSDPQAMLTAALLHAYGLARRHHQFNDEPSELPDGSIGM